MSSVASSASVVASVRPFEPARGPSAAENAGEATPFAMLLEANSDPSAAPQPDRFAPAKAQRHDDPLHDRRADSAPNAPKQSNFAPNANGVKSAASTSDDNNVDCSSDVAESKIGGDESHSDENSNDEDNNELTVTGDGELTIAVSIDACMPPAPAFVVASPAIVFVAPAINPAPVQPATTQDMAIAPTATSPAAPMPGSTAPDIPQTEQLVTAQAAPGDQPAQAGKPAEAGQTLGPLEAPEPANAATPAIPAAPPAPNMAAPIKSATQPAGYAAPAPAATPATSAMPAAPAEVTQKIAPGDQTEITDLNDAIEPAKAARQMMPAAPVAPAPATQVAKLASIEQATPAKVESPQANSLNATAATTIEVANTDAKPIIVAHNQVTKDSVEKAEGEPSPTYTHHAAAEPKLEPNADAANRITESASLGGHVESAQSPTPPQPAPHAVGTAMPVAAAPTIAAATAAIALTALPVEIAARAKDGKNRFEIRLDPPELGRIDIRLDIDRNGHVISRLMVERPETLDLLRRDAQQIERALQDAGLKTSEQGLQFSLRNQSEQDDDALPLAASLVLVQDDIVRPAALKQGYGQLLGLGNAIDIRV